MPLVDSQILNRIPQQQRQACLRDAQEVLLERARWLLPGDRTVIELVLRHGIPHRRISQLVNLPAGTVTRKLHRLARRLTSPLVVALLNERCPLPDPMHRIGVEHFLQGLSLRQLAERHGISRHEVRLILHNVRGWHRWSTASV